MLGVTLKGVKNMASKIVSGATSAARSRLSSIQMCTTNPNIRTTLRRVSTLLTDYESLVDARTSRENKIKEYERVDRKIKNLVAEKNELSQEIKDLKEEIAKELVRRIDYHYVRLFCRGTITAECFEDHFGFLPTDKSIAVCMNLSKKLIKAEEDLQLTEQQLLADTQSLIPMLEDITTTTKQITTLQKRLPLSSPKPKKFLNAAKEHLPNWKQVGKLLTATTTSLANLDAYPVSPMKVEQISTSNFLKYCKNHGYIDTLNSVETTFDFVEAFACCSLHADLYDEKSVDKEFTSAIRCLLHALNQTSTENNSIPKDLSLYGKLVSGGLVGRVDFDINCKSEDGNRKPLIMGEFKGPGFPTTNLADQYCDHTCKNMHCGSQRHEDHSVIRQLYNYMVRNNLLVGIYTNYLHTHVFIRDWQGHLLITEPILWDDEGDIDRGNISTLQIVALAILLAADKNDMNFDAYGHPMMVRCNSTEQFTIKSLPRECASSLDLKRPKRGCLPNGSPPLPRNKSPPSTLNKYGAKYTKDGEAVELVKLRKAGCTALSSGRTGSVFRLNFHEAGDDKSDNVVKVLDLVKQADQMDDLDNEAEIYKQLEPLQGIHIPVFIDCGVFDERFLYGLGTKYSGEPLTPEDITDDFVEKAVNALGEIHSHGVLHGDVTIRNILYNKKTQRPVIIDFGMAVAKSRVTEEGFALSADEEINELRRALEIERSRKN